MVCISCPDTVRQKHMHTVCSIVATQTESQKNKASIHLSLSILCLLHAHICACIYAPHIGVYTHSYILCVCLPFWFQPSGFQLSVSLCDTVISEPINSCFSLSRRHVKISLSFCKQSLLQFPTSLSCNLSNEGLVF